MKKSSTFVPSPVGQLEARVVPSGAPHFTPNGAAILTFRAINNVVAGVENAYFRFGHNLNFAQLTNNLARAVNPIPYNIRGGLVAAMSQEVATLQTNLFNGGVNRPLYTSMFAAGNDIRAFFIQAEVADGAHRGPS